MSTDFAGAFAQLRGILKKHSAGMVIQNDTGKDFTVITRSIGPNKKPMWFGAVLLKKSAVTFHLVPLYFNPKLQATVGPNLLRRKQGKTCFNFQRPDPELFAELDSLIQRSRDMWEKLGFLEEGVIPPERFAAALRAGGEDPVALAKLRKAKGAAVAKKRAATKAMKAIKKKK